MQTKIYGYIRISSTDQNEERQQIALRERKVPKQNIYMDTWSGRDFDRPQYLLLLKQLKKGDTLYILSIDRLGRNYREIQKQWQFLTKDMGVDICVIDMPLLDTRLGKDLIGTFIADLVLQVRSFAAQNERENILERQMQGIRAAKARGVRFGRPPHPLPPNFPTVYRRWRDQKISASAAARECRMPLSTFLYRAKRYHTNNQ